MAVATAAIRPDSEAACGHATNDMVQEHARFDVIATCRTNRRAANFRRCGIGDTLILGISAIQALQDCRTELAARTGGPLPSRENRAG